MMNISRREYVRIATSTTAGLASGFGRSAFARDRPNEKPLYCFPVLGDIHYDKMDHHDLDWVRREKPGDERQMIGYSEVTAKYTPALLRQVSGVVQASVAPVPFVVQVGDLVEGLCGSYALQERQFNEAFAAIEAAKLGAPMLVTKGNHDVTGPGAAECYDQTLLPWLAERSKLDITRSNFSVRQDDDLFVFFDCYKPDLPWLEKTLSAGKARHVFFVVHQPIVPYNARSSWIVYARDKHKRGGLLSLLGRHRAIVLSGHLHKYAMLSRRTDAGTFTELAVCSVVRASPAAVKEHRVGKERYTPDLLDLEPTFEPATRDARRAVLEAEIPHVSAFDYADAPGFALVEVYKDRVDTDLYLAGVQEIWKTPRLVAVI